LSAACAKRLGTALLALVLAPMAIAQSDPFALPSPRPASPGAYQWGLEMLRFERAWAVTKGRAHVAMPEKGAIAPHEDLASGLDGPLRPHISDTLAEDALYHSTMTVGVLAARGFNGKGISGACPFCSVSLYDGATSAASSAAIASGAGVISLSAGIPLPADSPPRTCALGNALLPDFCPVLSRAEERDAVYVAIAHNVAVNRVAFPASHPTVIGVGGLQPDGKFWKTGYDSSNPGSSYGPEIRLLAPSTDILTTHPRNGRYSVTGLRCGELVDSPNGGERTLPASYAGYGDCNGTSFSAPFVAAIAALMRSANPLLTAAEVRSIIYGTATRPVAGPEGSGLTFYIPDAGAAVQAAAGPLASNRGTPMFSLFSSGAARHLFTSSPQVALAAAAGEFRRNGQQANAVYESFGDPVPGMARFHGIRCSDVVQCVVPARRAFYLFATENSPASHPLVPLYRMTQVCQTGGEGCASTRAFAYATSADAVRELERRGYVLDVVEGFIYLPEGSAPPGTLPLCLGYDAARIDHILYARAQCDRTQFTAASGDSSGGNYAHVAMLGYVPTSGFGDPERNHTAMWWNADESGWGVNFAHQGDTVFATLFTYDSAGKPLWLVMSNGARQGGADTYSGPLYRTTGPAFNAVPFTPIGAANVAQVGTMRVTFGAAETTLDYEVDGTRVAKKIAKQVFGARAAQCAPSSDSRAALVNYQDMWWNPAESGWGLNIAHQGDTLFATLFTYAADGSPLWLVMAQGLLKPDGGFEGDLYRTRGSAFNAQPFVPVAPADVTKVGTMRLRFADGASGTLEYSVDGVPVTKAITRQVFDSPVPHCTH
jgi:subtilisin family serine protease